MEECFPVSSLTDAGAVSFMMAFFDQAVCLLIVSVSMPIFA